MIIISVFYSLDNHIVKKCIIITGATGSGKSKYAIELAKKINGVIINADSMQIYKHIPIITAQPTENDKREVEHYLYDFLNIDNQTYSVGKYLIDLKCTLDKLQKINPSKTPIIVGGTMLYIDAIVNGLSKIPEIPEKIAQNVREMYNNKTTEQLFQELERVDYPYSKVVDASNPHRILRGIEIKLGTGKSILDFWQDKKDNIFEKDYTFEKYILNIEREKLYARIDTRFDKMIEEGAIEEAKNVKKMIENDILDKTSLPKAIGLQHLLDYLDKKITLETAIELSKRDSRHYAKRQITWFNNRFNDFKEIKF